MWNIFKEFKFENFLKNKKENEEVALKYIRTNFLRFIPLNSINEHSQTSSKTDFSTYVNIDGEAYKMEPFQIKVRQKCINIYSYGK